MTRNQQSRYDEVKVAVKLSFALVFALTMWCLPRVSLAEAIEGANEAGEVEPFALEDASAAAEGDAAVQDAAVQDADELVPKDEDFLDVDAIGDLELQNEDDLDEAEQDPLLDVIEDDGTIGEDDELPNEEFDEPLSVMSVSDVVRGRDYTLSNDGTLTILDNPWGVLGITKPSFATYLRIDKKSENYADGLLSWISLASSNVGYFGFLGNPNVTHVVMRTGSRTGDNVPLELLVLRFPNVRKITTYHQLGLDPPGSRLAMYYYTTSHSQLDYNEKNLLTSACDVWNERYVNKAKLGGLSGRQGRMYVDGYGELLVESPPFKNTRWQQNIEENGVPRKEISCELSQSESVADLDGLAFTYNRTSQADAIQREIAVRCMSGHHEYVFSSSCDVEYEVSFFNERTGLANDTTNAGGIRVTITGTGAHAGTIEGHAIIDPQRLGDSSISLQSEAYSYTGKPITPAPVVRDESNEVLSEGVDYTVSYASNTDLGLARVIVTGKGNYTGSGSATFKITKPVSALDVTAPKAQSYTGKALTPAPTVKDGSKALAAGTDYTLSYSGNVNVGTATVTVTGKGYYTGSRSVTFKITKPVSALDVTAPKAQSYIGKALTPVPTVKDGSKALAAGTDYTLSYKNNTDAGTATVTVTGKGNYTGSRSVTFKISPRSLSKVSVTAPKAQVYTGKALKPAPVVKDGSKALAAGTDYTLSYKNNTDAGTATVTVTGKGNYTGSRSVTFKISPRSLSKVSVTAPKAQAYTGKALKPAPVVKDGSKALVKGTDYTLSYKKNVKVGTATVTVTGKGNYTGSVSKKFRIAKSFSKVSVSFPKTSKGGYVYVGKTLTFAYTGKAFKPAPVVKNGSKTLAKGTDYTLSYKNNTDAGTATVTVTGKGNYTGSKSLTFKIVPRTLSKVSVTAPKAQVYTGKALTPAPVVKDGSKALAAGTDFTLSYKRNVKVGTATVTVTGKGNYQGKHSVTFAITKAANPLVVIGNSAQVNASNVKYGAYTFDTTPVTVANAKGSVSLREVSGSSCLSYDAKGNSVTLTEGTSRGTYDITIEVKASGDANYRPATKTATFTVRVKEKVRETCTFCNNGKCTSCDGSGYDRWGDLCPICVFGTCPICHGKGYVEYNR